MSDMAIRVKGLGKEYYIGGEQKRHKTLRESLSDAFVTPFRRAGNLLRGQATGAAELNETISALKDVSFEVKRGEVVGLIGRNGAGKTTLLRLLSRITAPSAGYAEIQGRVGTLLEVGTGFHSELTGRENTYLNGAILGMKKAEIHRKFDEIVAFAEVEKFIDTPVKHYSTGMSVRLAFAVAAHLEPEILLVDEVLAVGDVGFQKKCLGAMNNLGRGGRTILFVSHNMAAIENLCSHAIWLDNGQIRQDGDASEVIKAYLSTFVGAERASHDLHHIRTRSGLGAVQYTKIEFLSVDRQPQKLIRSGDSLVVRLHYHASERVSYPDFGLQLNTELGTKVTLISTWATGDETPELPPDDGFVDLEIDFLNLMPGRYYVTLHLSSGGGHINQDRVDHCATLDVVASDFYQSGKGIHSNFGIIFLPARWKFKGLYDNKNYNDCLQSGIEQ